MKTFSITDAGAIREMNQDFYFSSDTAVGKILYGIIRNRNVSRNPLIEEMIEKIREKINQEK